MIIVHFENRPWINDNDHRHCMEIKDGKRQCSKEIIPAATCPPIPLTLSLLEIDHRICLRSCHIRNLEGNLKVSQ